MQAMTNGVDVFIVEKPTDLPEMLAEYYDDETWTLIKGRPCGWSALPDNHPLTNMYMEEDFGIFGPLAGDLPDGSVVELFDHSYFVTAPVFCWTALHQPLLIFYSFY